MATTPPPIAAQAQSGKAGSATLAQAPASIADTPESAQALVDRLFTEPNTHEMTDLSRPGAILTESNESATGAMASVAAQPISATSVLHTDGASESKMVPIAAGDSEATPAQVASTPSTPTASFKLVITLLIPATDARHRFTVDDDYMKNHNITLADRVPSSMGVYTLKEAVWRDWRDDWEPRPSSPSAIRLIHMGRMLDDKSYLKDNRFSVGDTPHVVHMTVRPQETQDDDDGKMGKGSSRRNADGEERTAGCRCIIM